MKYLSTNYEIANFFTSNKKMIKEVRRTSTKNYTCMKMETVNENVYIYIYGESWGIHKKPKSWFRPKFPKNIKIIWLVWKSD